MKSWSRVGVAAAALLAGLSVSSGRWPAIAAGVLLPALALRTHSRRESYQTAVVYYSAALWPLVPGANNFFGSDVSLLLAFGLWTISATLLAIPWLLVWSTDPMQALWRAPLGILLTILPPLGIIGWASPILAAGILFPALGWWGLLCSTVFTGALGVWPRWASLSMGVVAAIANLAAPADPLPPREWVAVNTQFGSISHESANPLVEYAAAQDLQHEATARHATVILFPETVATYWTASTDVFWEHTLATLRASGKTIIVGARIPLALLPSGRIADFSASLATLRGDAYRGLVSRPGDEPVWHPRYLNAMIVRGSQSAEVPQRIPVPIAMWNPFRFASAQSNWLASGLVQIETERAGIVICYEQLIAWPVLLTMAAHPTVLLAPANDYWAKQTTIQRFQQSAMRSWARLFGLPCLFAVNT